MTRRRFSTDDRVVAPAVGVVIAIVMVFVLAAIIGPYAAGLANDLQEPPQVTFEYTLEKGGTDGSDAVKIEHAGGSVVLARQLTVKTSEPVLYSDADSGLLEKAESFRWSAVQGTTEEVETSDHIRIYATSGDRSLDDIRIQIVWESEDNDDTSILSERTV